MKLLVDVNLPPALARWLASDGHEARATRACKFGLAAALAAAVMFTPLRVPAATSYEAQVGGLIHSLLSPFVIGEFGGRTSANPHYNQRPICKPGDYEDLREAAKDDGRLLRFTNDVVLSNPQRTIRMSTASPIFLRDTANP